MVSLSTDYELLVRDIHAALLRNDAVENIAVQHNVKIKGRSGAVHQIDVYWEFKLAGVKYKTCIECKHFNRRVTKGYVAAFLTVIDDIGNATGIFATTVGYQKGAKTLAAAKDVRLLVVNNLLKAVGITSHLSFADTHVLSVKYDLDQARRLLVEKGLDSFEVRKLWQPTTVFFNKDGEPTTTFREYINKSVTEDGVGTLYPEELYDATELGLLRVSEVNCSRYTHRVKSEQEIVVNDTLRAIVEDLAENSSLYVHDDGSISHIEA